MRKPPLSRLSTIFKIVDCLKFALWCVIDSRMRGTDQEISDYTRTMVLGTRFAMFVTIS